MSLTTSSTTTSSNTTTIPERYNSSNMTLPALTSSTSPMSTTSQLPPPASFKYFNSNTSNQLLATTNSDMMMNRAAHQMDGFSQDSNMFSNNRKLLSASPVSVLPNLKEFLQETYSSYPSHTNTQNNTATPHVSMHSNQRQVSDDNVSHISSQRKYETYSNTVSYPCRTAVDSPNGFFACLQSSTNSRNNSRPQYQHAPHTPTIVADQNLSPLFERISQLEKQLERQSVMIIDLERENNSLRYQINESEKRLNSAVSNSHVLHSNACADLPPNPEPIKTRARNNVVKKRRESPTHEYNVSSPVSNGSSYEKPSKSSKLSSKQTSVSSSNGTSFSIVDESEKDHTKSQKPVGDLDDFSVKWKGKTYVLIDAFKNRTQILNYFVPLFQNKYPEKSCKLVLCNEDYKALFKENFNRSNSEKKHAWRVSIFTIEFYNFVKSQQVDN
ncbi:predicted protein [Naegleria gruberi]|uniref:Predicted protein n=1 Tax=Naegleria gruberi TaxID=5762 RepID=D2VXH1_NAEGR|nr:uncharacterized protein NAEGRDRAFT_73745 [Naegleria gruberi]EFC38506.1 predicted protein [Naegleria gruberi]|eukprot:XP_002671250.1 predicted protein [Naegleria gruberi strain NEG-M]